MNKKKEIQSVELHEQILQSKVFIVRGVKVMRDEDLTGLYQTETKLINKAVKRNISRFPVNFIFQLTKNEEVNLRSQFVTLDLRFQTGTSKKGGRKYLPLAFTEQGVAMPSSVLKSERAIAVNI